jgi:hypothetical protein
MSRTTTTTIIPLNEAKLMAYYEKIMDEVYTLYHTHPTNIPRQYPTETELSRMSEGANMARQYERQLQSMQSEFRAANMRQEASRCVAQIRELEGYARTAQSQARQMQLAEKSSRLIVAAQVEDDNAARSQERRGWFGKVHAENHPRDSSGNYKINGMEPRHSGRR